MAVLHVGGFAVAADWPELGLDEGRGRSSKEKSGALFTAAWQFDAAAGPVLASPAVADGYVVLASSQGMVNVLRAAGGARMWRFDAGGEISASPAIHQGRVFVPTLEGTLVALGLANGARLWARPFGGQNHGSPTISGDSLVLAAGFPAQKIVKVRMSSGMTLWETTRGAIEGLVNSSPAIGNDMVVIGTNTGRYQQMALATGAVQWNVATGGSVVLSAPLLVDDRAYLLPGGASAALFAVNTIDGSVLPGWPVTITDPVAPPAGSIVSRRQAVSSPIVADDLIVFQIRFEYGVTTAVSGVLKYHMREYVVGVNRLTTSVAWQQANGTKAGNINDIPELNLCPTPAAYAGAAGADGQVQVVVASSLEPTLRVLNAATGAESWMQTLSAPTRSSPIFADGQLYVATQAGILHAFVSRTNVAPDAPFAEFSPRNRSPLETGGRLRWLAATDREGDSLSYEVRIDSDGEILVSWLARMTSEPGQSSVVLPAGLTPGVTYTYAVRSRDPSGAWSEWSVPQTFEAAGSPSIDVAGVAEPSLAAALAEARPGTDVRIGRGILRLAAPVTVPAGVGVIGAGAHETIIKASGLETAIRVAGGRGSAEIRGLTISGADVGIEVTGGREATLRNLVLRDNRTSALEVAGPDSAAHLINATLVRNGVGARSSDDAALNVRNSIIVSNQMGLVATGTGRVTSRYNNVFDNKDGNYAEGAAPGVGDMAVATVFGALDNDDVRIMLRQKTTDKGDPADAYDQEPQPNGGRVNLGAYGNTPLAERSQSTIRGAKKPGEWQRDLEPETVSDQVAVQARTGSDDPARAAVPGGCSMGGGRAGNGAGGFGFAATALALIILAGISRKARLRVVTAAKGFGHRLGVVAVLLGGLLLTTQAHAITRVQKAVGANAGATTVAATWGANTVSGSLLVAVIAVRGGSGTAITPPAGPGWTLAVRKDNGTTISTAVYYIENAAAQTAGASTWTLTPSAKATLLIAEYDGVLTTGALDATNSDSGTGTLMSSGTAAAPSGTTTVAIAAVSAAGTAAANGTFSTIQNSFTSVNTTTSTGGTTDTRNRSTMLEKFYTTGTESSGQTISQSEVWVGAIATFKGTYNRYWTGAASTDWNTFGNWSLTSGGPSNAPVPLSTDTIIFNSNGAVNCVLANSKTVDAVNIASSYANTFTVNALKTLTAPNVTVAGGTFTVNGTLTSSTLMTITGGTVSGTLSATGTLDVQGGTVSNDSGATIATMTMSGGTYANSNSAADKTTLTMAGGTFTDNGGEAIATLNLNGGIFENSTAGLCDITTLAMTAGTLRNVAVGQTIDILGTGSAATASGGTINPNAGTIRFYGGLTTSGTNTISMTSSTDIISIAPGKTLTIGGTLTASVTSPGTGQFTRTSAGNYAFSVGSTATLNLDGLRVDYTDINGMNIGNGATFTLFKRVKFYNNVGTTGSVHVKITANSLALNTSGVYFDNTADYNVQLIGNGDSDGETRALFEDRGAATNGPGAGESNDSDDDSAGDGTGDNPLTNGAVIDWLALGNSNTTGTIEGFVSAAFDWSTFTYYATYVAIKDIGGANTADRIYKRDLNGDPLSGGDAYYEVADSNGNIVGTPRWDTVNETTLGLDVNGDGDQLDTAVHVLYFGTTTGKLYKLIDDGTSLALPASGNWSTAFSNATVTAVTSSLISDGTNLYFGGSNASSSPRVFGVQITGGASEKTLVKNIGAASTITTTPAFKVFNGSSYLFLGSTATGGQAYIYRVEVAPGAAVEATYTGALHNVNGGIRLFNNKVIIGDSGGRLHRITADAFPGTLTSVSGYPYRDTTTHTVSFLDAGSASISQAPSPEAANGRTRFGDLDGHLYVVDVTGAAISGYPIRITSNEQLTTSPLYLSGSGVIVIGTSGGNVHFVDQNNGTTGPSLFKKMKFNGSISQISYNGSTSEYMVALTNGQFFFVAQQSDPTPSSL